VNAGSIKNKKAWIVVLTCGVVVVTILLVLYLYEVNKQDVISQFQQAQLRYAKSMVLLLGSHFQPATEGMPDDVKRFLTDEAGLAMQSLGSQRLWIMDWKGMLLFHPAHEEMVPRNIYQKNERCIHCHKSFSHIERIVSGRQETLDYQGGNSLRMIAGPFRTPQAFRESLRVTAHPISRTCGRLWVLWCSGNLARVALIIPKQQAPSGTRRECGAVLKSIAKNSRSA
jgi:hypothetical protein